MPEKQFSDSASSGKELRSRVKLLEQLPGNVLIKHEDPAAVKAWKEPLLSTINAIAAGMRNTG